MSHHNALRPPDRPPGLARLAFAALLALWVTADALAGDPTAGEHLAERLGCGACHGARGISPDQATPNLAGQDWSYLVAQLRAFADPEAAERDPPPEVERHHEGMQGVTKGLGYADIDNLARYYSSLTCVPESVPDYAAIPAPARGCARCHGPYGINIEPGVPTLSGQKASYIVSQLRALRASRYGVDPTSTDQERHGAHMDDHAVTLSDAEIETIAGFFSRLACR